MQDKELNDTARKLTMIWNMYDFFTMYAEVDKWEWTGTLDDPSSELTNPLDIWIVSRMHQLVAEVEAAMNDYDMSSAVKPILPFIEDASNWYVRRSRRRFWKSEDDNDKLVAYKTLHYVLVRLSYVLAPFTPFLAEELFQKLTGGESVHLEDWLPAGGINEAAVHQMAAVREAINIGLSQRATAKIKTRQPLQSVKVFGLPDLSQDLIEVVAEELNVKSVELVAQLPQASANQSVVEVVENAKGTQGTMEIKVELNVDITPELKREGLMREVVRNVQNARKDAGLNVDDRISLVLLTGDVELSKAIEEFSHEIKGETLANDLSSGSELTYVTEVKVEGALLKVSLQKS